GHTHAHQSEPAHLAQQRKRRLAATVAFRRTQRQPFTGEVARHVADHQLFLTQHTFISARGNDHFCLSAAAGIVSSAMPIRSDCTAAVARSTVIFSPAVAQYTPSSRILPSVSGASFGLPRPSGPV